MKMWNLMKKQYKRLIVIEIAIILSILVTYLIVKTNIIGSFPKCIFYEKFGIFCPSCGGTRFISNLFEFRFWNAFLVQPIFFITAIYLGVLNIIYVVNVLLNKKINIFRVWHVIVWIIMLLIHTIIINIINKGGF